MTARRLAAGLGPGLAGAALAVVAVAGVPAGSGWPPPPAIPRPPAAAAPGTALPWLPPSVPAPADVATARAPEFPVAVATVAASDTPAVPYARDVMLAVHGELREEARLRVLAVDGTGLVRRRYDPPAGPTVRLAQVPTAARWLVIVPDDDAVPVCVTLPGAQDDASLPVELRPARVVHGTGHDPAGRPLSGCEVLACWPVDGGPLRVLDRAFPAPRLARLDARGTTLTDGGLVRASAVDGWGRFRLDGLPWGPVEVELRTEAGAVRRRVGPGEVAQLTGPEVSARP